MKDFKKEYDDLQVTYLEALREIKDLKKRLKNMQALMEKRHDEIRDLRDRLGIKRYGALNTSGTQKVKDVDNSNNV